MAELTAPAALAAWLLVVLAAGEAVRIRRERAAAAARIREEEERRRASEERLRMARELHDSLGHYLSLISVQSGVALNLNQQLPEQVRASLTTVRQASKEAQPVSGNGIAGMRERVAALGGEFDAGPRPEGGFRVRARFPLGGAG